jgi:hypothetical protein
MTALKGFEQAAICFRGVWLTEYAPGCIELQLAQLHQGPASTGLSFVVTAQRPG